MRGLMDKRATFSTRSTATDSAGHVKETWAAGSTVWGSLSSAREGREASAGRYQYPVTHRLLVDPHAEAVAGNRVTVDGSVYDILGAPALSSLHYVALDLREVTH